MSIKAEDWPTTEQFAEVACLVAETEYKLGRISVTENGYASVVWSWNPALPEIGYVDNFDVKANTPRAAMAALIARLRVEFGVSDDGEG